MRIKPFFFYLIILACFIPEVGQSQSLQKDIVYARTKDRNLQLDIYSPKNVPNPPLVIWVHGGAWHSGTKENPPLIFVERGFALASIYYRLSIEAPFPAMIHDIKAAIRFLRGNANEYGYNADKFVIAGSSAGGHLAALVGTTNGHGQLEGDLGEHSNVSSDVQLILDFYGPTNFKTILKQSTPHGINVRAPALALLLGKPVEKVPELAELASPVFHVDAQDPPLFIAHGDQDIQVPVNQSLELRAVYRKYGLNVQLEIVPGAGHSSKEVFSEEVMEMVLAFMKKSLSTSKN